MARRRRPPKKPTVKIFGGTPGAPAPPEVETHAPDMPLDVARLPAAREFWDWAIAELTAMRVLSPADREIIALAAKEKATIVKLEFELADPESGKAMTFVAKTGYEAETPWVRMLDNAKKRLRDCLKDLGLSPAARSRIKIKGHRPADKLEDFAKSKKNA